MNVTDEIKRRLDILEVLGPYVQLKRTGRSYKGLCPFHSEKTPSFIVFPESQNWRCFGCGRGGDIFNFIMEREGWEFREALEFLAGKAGVELAPRTPAQQQQDQTEERLLGLISEAAAFYHRSLLESPAATHARAYAVGRGFSENTLAAFQFGYAPNSYEAIQKALMPIGYSQQDLIDAGLLVQRDDGRVYDRFRDRLLIPIQDPRGRIVGFGGRVLSKDAQPKYLNSPQSAVFDKSRLLFGFSQARRSIREKGRAVIVEGYMDAIQAHQAGFTDVVAQMGTAFTESQLRLLAPLANRLVLALDPDSAGQMATDRGREVIERFSQQAAQEAAAGGEAEGALISAEFSVEGILRYQSRLSFDIRVAILPDGMDPDDLIRENPQAWADLVEGALPIVEYVIQQEIAGRNVHDPGVKAEIVGRITPLINELPDAVTRTHYRQRLARLLRLDERALLPQERSVVSKEQKKFDSRRSPRPSGANLPTRAETTMASLEPPHAREQFCLAALLQHPRLIYRVNRMLAESLEQSPAPLWFTDEGQALQPPELSGQIVPTDFVYTEHRAIFSVWREALAQDDLDPMLYLYEHLPPDLIGLVSGWLAQKLDSLRPLHLPEAGSTSDQRVQEEALRGFLELRLRALEAHTSEIQSLLDEDVNGESAASLADLARNVTTLIMARSGITSALKRTQGPRSAVRR